MNHPPAAAERILVVQSGFLGDVVLTTPVLAALRRSHPSAQLVMLVTPAAVPLVAGHPALDAVLVDDKRGRDRGVLGLAALVRRIRQHRFTVGLAAHKSLRTALALRLAGVPRRIGFDTAPGAPLYSERVARPLDLHDRDRILGLLEPLGAVPRTEQERNPWIAVSADARTRAAVLLGSVLGNDERPLAGICPASAWPTKRWPARAYGELVLRLEREGFRCVLLGAPSERAITAEVRTVAGESCVDLGGATDVALLAALLARMAVVVTNDSAPMHVATALGIPQVSVFCATVPAQGYGPLGPRSLIVEKDLACRPCGRHGGRRCPRGTDDCMQLIEVAEVHAAVGCVLAAAA